MFASKERNAKRLAKKIKKENLLKECEALKTKHPSYTKTIGSLTVELNKASKTAEIGTLEKRVNQLKTEINLKLAQEKKAAEETTTKEKIAEEKQQLDKRIQTLTASCSSPTPTLPDDPDEPFIVSANRQQFTNLSSNHEVERKVILNSIANMHSLNEEKELEANIKQFLAQEEKVIAELNTISKTILQKKNLLKNIIENEKGKVDQLFTSVYQNPFMLNDQIVCDAQGLYTKHNQPGQQDEKKALQEEQLPKAPSDIVVTTLYNLVKQSRIQLVKQIADWVENDEKAADKLQPLQQAIVDSKGNVDLLAEMVVKRKAFVDSRNALMAKLHLDKTKLEDLEFWTKENAPCFHGYGGCEITWADEKNQIRPFRIPTRIANMMKVIAGDYTDKENFEKDFDIARTARPSLFSNPLSFWTRSPLSQMIYSANNREELPELEIRNNKP